MNILVARFFLRIHTKHQVKHTKDAKRERDGDGSKRAKLKRGTNAGLSVDPFGTKQ